MKTNEKINYQANHGTKQETLEREISSAGNAHACGPRRKVDYQRSGFEELETSDCPEL